MEITMRGRPEFSFDLQVECIDLLYRLSYLHYDAHCRSYSGDGGLIAYWKKMSGMADMVADGRLKCYAKWRDLDTICKILEMSSMTVSYNDRQNGRNMAEAFGHCLARGNLRTDVWKEVWTYESL